jgi:DNA-binding NarL/FixJ family response regulator
MGATAKQKVDLSKYSRELTEFEEQTLFELFQGKKNLVIAHDTGHTLSAVKHAVYELCNKLGASNRIECVQMSIAQGVLHSRYGYWGA